MNTKLLYVVVSSETDIYLEQAYVSMLSARHHMPNVHITLLIDSLTKKSLTGIREKESSIADEIVTIDLDSSFSAQKRSRLLKTNARNYIKGNFLFIDCDTIIVKPLDKIDCIEADIAACWDSHALFKDNPYRSMCLEHGKSLCWPIENELEYFNSGIIFARDNTLIHNFYKKWCENYENGYFFNVSMDQPSLAKTNFEFDHKIKRLDDIWNCEFKHGMRYFKDAKIIHYLCTNKSNGQLQPFILNDDNIFLDIKRNGSVKKEIIDLFDDPSKGIASLSCLIAGRDVFFYNDKLISFFRYLYNVRPQLYNTVSKLVSSLLCIKNKIGKKK